MRGLGAAHGLLACAAVMAASAVHAEDLSALMARCVPDVHPKTMAAIVRVESTAQKYVISDDGPGNLPYSERKALLRSFYPSSLEEAAGIAKDLIGRGHWVGLGLTQIASRHLPGRGLSVEQALDPCTNLREGGRILVDSYVSALKRYPDPQEALYAAISAYNTGNFVAGFSNGYVQKVVTAAGYKVPELRDGRPVAGVKRGQVVAVSSSRNTTSRGPTPLQARFARLEAENF